MLSKAQITENIKLHKTLMTWDIFVIFTFMILLSKRMNTAGVPLFARIYIYGGASHPYVIKASHCSYAIPTLTHV